MGDLPTAAFRENSDRLAASKKKNLHGDHPIFSRRRALRMLVTGCTSRCPPSGVRDGQRHPPTRCECGQPPRADRLQRAMIFSLERNWTAKPGNPDQQGRRSGAPVSANGDPHSARPRRAGSFSMFTEAPERGTSQRSERLLGQRHRRAPATSYAFSERLMTVRSVDELLEALPRRHHRADGSGARGLCS